MPCPFQTAVPTFAAIPAGSTAPVRSTGEAVLVRRSWGTLRQVTNRAMVSQWLAGYEAAWRTPGSQALASLFTGDATYLQSPYAQPVTGLDAIKRMWEDEREGPDEVFTLTVGILAVEGPTAVVRAEVRYGGPPRQEYRDL